jgi:LemA protein
MKKAREMIRMAKNKEQETQTEPKKKLSTGWLVGIVVIIVIALIIMSGIGMYNGLVKSEVAVDNQWANVQAVYQRRADLIPNLVETVKGAKNFEQQTLIAITEARSAWTNAKTPEEQVAAANGVESALSRLMVVVENYPELKSNQNFLALQDELANTENKIAVERQRYNGVVQTFNTQLRVFPTSIVAGMFGFGKRTFFAATQGAENAPGVQF